MPSSPTTSNRFQKTAAGEHNNTWATDLDTNLDLIDATLDGWLEVALVGNTTLTSVNYTTDQSRYRMLHFTGTGAFTVTVPNVSKNYKVKNSCTGIVTLTNSTTSVAIQPTEVCDVITDGASNFDRVAPDVFAGPVTLSGGLSMAANEITAVKDPTTPQSAATKNYIDTQTLAATLVSFPARPSNRLKGLRVTSDESAVEWAVLGFSGQNAKAANYSVLAADREKLIRCTGSFTLTLGAVSGFDAAFGVYVRNEGTGTITVAGSSATVDGLASYLMYPGELRLFSNDGANWQSVVLAPFSKTWTVTDAGFIWPPGYQAFEGLGWGGGGGGGCGASSNLGGSGGGGGCGLPYLFPATSITAGATATITVAAGGAGNAGGGAGGVVAVSGGNSSVAALVTFYGGAGGVNIGGNAGGGGGALGAGASPGGGAPSTSATATDNPGFGGASGPASVSAGNHAAYGGASGGCGATGSATAGAGGRSYYGGGGGGGGSGTGTAGIGGTSVFGGAGGAGATNSGNGVAGSAPGGGGGGGNGNAGTAGGNGARGEVRMWGVV